MQHSTRARLRKILDGSPVTGTDRNYALTLAGSSQLELAQKLGVTQPAIHRVLFDKSTSYNIASAIAAETGLTLNRLWPCGKYSTPPAERKRAADRLREAA